MLRHLAAIAAVLILCPIAASGAPVHHDASSDDCMLVVTSHHCTARLVGHLELACGAEGCRLAGAGEGIGASSVPSDLWITVYLVVVGAEGGTHGVCSNGGVGTRIGCAYDGGMPLSLAAGRCADLVLGASVRQQVSSGFLAAAEQGFLACNDGGDGTLTLK